MQIPKWSDEHLSVIINNYFTTDIPQIHMTDQLEPQPYLKFVQRIALLFLSYLERVSPTNMLRVDDGFQVLLITLFSGVFSLGYLAHRDNWFTDIKWADHRDYINIEIPLDSIKKS